MSEKNVYMTNLQVLGIWNKFYVFGFLDVISRRDYLKCRVSCSTYPFSVIMSIRTKKKQRMKKEERKEAF